MKSKCNKRLRYETESNMTLCVTSLFHCGGSSRNLLGDTKTFKQNIFLWFLLSKAVEATTDSFGRTLRIIGPGGQMDPDSPGLQYELECRLTVATA